MGTISLRVDDKLKKDAIKVFEELGLDLSTGIKIYLQQVVINGGIPFDVTLEKSDLELALEDIASGRVESFNNLDELLKDLK